MTISDATATNLLAEQAILLQWRQLPDDLKHEALEFIRYLLAKHEKGRGKPQDSRKKGFGKYRGSLKTGLALAEIDAQLQQLRNEWERPI